MENVSFQNVRVDAINVGLRDYMNRTFGYMSVGLFITGITSFLCAASGITVALIKMPLLFFIIAIAPIFISVAISRSNNMPSQTAKMWFYVYTAAVGVSLSTIFLAYTATSIASSFFVTSSAFMAMAIYGYATDRDISSYGSILFMSLLGVIIASIVGIFIQNSAFHLIISVANVVLFSGMTAYDVHILKREYISNDGRGDRNLLAVKGALHIYLDFINLFTSIIRLIGVRKD